MWVFTGGNQDKGVLEFCQDESKLTKTELAWRRRVVIGVSGGHTYKLKIKNCNFWLLTEEDDGRKEMKSFCFAQDGVISA